MVIEEDGKTEEEFVADLETIGDELNELATTSRQLEAVINQNIRRLIGE